VSDLIKIDAQKAGDVNIHAVEIDRVLDDNARELFGNEPVHFAVRANAIFVAAGEGNLAALKQALSVQPAPSDIVRLDVALSRLVPLMAKEQPAAPNASKEAFKNPGDDRIRLRATGGQALKADVHAKTAVLKFMSLIEKAKQNNEK